MWHSARDSTGSERSRLQPPSAVSVASSAGEAARRRRSRPARSRGSRAACRSSSCPAARVSRSRTGRPVSVAPSAATAARPCGCISLPPKPPPIRRHCTVTAWLGHAEHVRDDLLGLGRVLGAGLHEDLAALVDQRQRAVRLEVEVLLPGDRGHALEDVRRRAPARPPTSPRCSVGRAPWKLSAAIASSTRQQRGQRLVVDLDRRRAPRRAASRVSPSTQQTAWPWYMTSVGEQRLVVLDPGVVDAGHVGRGEHPDHARHVVRRRGVEPGDPRVGVRRLDRVGVQHVAWCRPTRSSV